MREREEVAEAVQLPKHAHVRTVSAHQFNVAVIIERPTVVCKWIAPPLDLLAETLFYAADVRLDGPIEKLRLTRSFEISQQLIRGHAVPRSPEAERGVFFETGAVFSFLPPARAC